MSDVIPRRLSKGNKSPTVLTVETDEVKTRWKWMKPPNFYTPEERMRVMAKLLEVMIKTVLDTITTSTAISYTSSK